MPNTTSAAATTTTEQPAATAASTELVRSTTQELIQRLLCPGTVTAEERHEQGRRSTVVQISSEHSKRLIGQHGANLQALQHVVRLLVSAKSGKPCFARVDVNGYRAEREQKVIDLAKAGAEKAARTDSMVILRPMTAFERRLVHVALEGDAAVTTESLGQEPNRRVVVKPVHSSRVVKSFSDKGLTLDDIKV